jgi:hypothetical protein
MPSQFITRPDGTVEHVRTGGKPIDPASIKKPDNSPRMMPGVLGDLQAAGLSGLVSAGQTLMRTGDVGKAIGAYYTGGAEDISQNASPTTRLIVAPARSLAQSALGNAPADIVSSAMGRPRPVGAPDAKLLGVLPALPKIKYQNPTEEVLGGFIQGAMGFFLASKGLKGAGGAAMQVPVVAGAARTAQPLVQASKTLGSFAKGAPGVTGVAAKTAIGTGSIVAQGAAPGFIVDYAGFDAGSTLTDQVLTWVEKQRGTPIHAPLLDLVRSAPGDTAADARWKSGVEGMFFVGPAASATIEGLGRVAKSIINLANARQAARSTDPNVPPEPPASGQTIDVTAAPVGPNAKVATDPNAGPGVTQAAPKSKPSAPDIAKAYMDMRPRTPLWEQQGVEVQGRLDDPRTDVQAATADFVKATTDAEIAVSRASNTVPDEAGPVPTVDRGNAMPSYSQVQETAVADIYTDPVRMQFKAAGQGKGKAGVTGSLKNAKSYDPLFGKFVSVWRDPETGRLLVVNGHNRLDLARRSGVKSILTWEIDAPTAELARAIGALENISEKQGTAWDAAKIMRDMGIDAEEMARRNIDITDGIAQKGVALSRLPQEIFDKGVTGELKLDKAVALGSVKLDDVVVRDVAAQAAKKGWPADKILQAMQEAKFAQTAEVTGGGVLPGFEDMFKTSNFEQLLDIRTEAFKALREEMVALTSVSREGRRGILEAAGNVVDVAGSQAARGQAAVAVEIFDRVTGYTGPVRDLLNEMAALVGPKRSAKAIVTENLERLRAAIEAEGGRPRLPFEQPPAQAVAPSVPSAGTSAAEAPVLARPAEPAAPGFAIPPRPVEPAAPAVSDEAIKALESAYPYTARAAEPPVDIAAGRLAQVKKLLQGTQEQIQQLKANPPEPSASAAVTAKQQRDWDKNLAKFVQQEAQVQKDLVVAQAALDRLTAAPAASAAELPDTRGQGQFFHGAAAEIKQLDEGYYETMNIYCQGFYTPDDLKTAKSYTKKNARSVAKTGGTPGQVIYQAVEREPVNFYDLDAPASDSVKQQLERSARYSQSVSDALDELDADPNISLAKLMDEIRAISPSVGESADTIQEVFEGLRETLEAEGYGGFTHVGGKLTKSGREHQVKIYWNPEAQLELKRYEAPEPGAQLASEQMGSLDPDAVRKAGEILPDQLPSSYRVDPDVVAAVKDTMINVVRRIAGDDVVVKFQDNMVFKEGTAAHGTEGSPRRIGGGYNLDLKSSIEGDPIKEVIDFYEMSLMPFKGATIVDYTKSKLNVAAHEAFHVLQLRSMTADQLKVMNTMFAKLKLYFAEKNRRGRASGRTDRPIEQGAQAFESYADAAAAGVSPGAVMLGVTPDDIKFFNEIKPTDPVEKTIAGAGKAILNGIALIDDMFVYAERLYNAFRGRGWTSVRDIFAQAYSGELKKQTEGLGSALDIVGMAEGQEKEWARRIRELDKQGVPGLKPMVDFARDERLLSEQPTQLTSEAPEGPRPVNPSPGPENSDEWVRRFAQQLGLTKEQLLSGEITYDDLLANSFQKTQSPSGQSIYTATKEDLVDGYNAMSKVLPDRAELSGIPAFTREELRSLNQAWLTRHGQDGEAIMRGLTPLIAGFEEYQLGALNRAMWLADKKQVEASMEAAMWLNSAGVEGLNESERLARLITAAESARATHEAVMRVTRPWGQLGVEMQVPRNYDAPPATGVAQVAGEPVAVAGPSAEMVGAGPAGPAGPPAEAVDIEEAITRELQVEGARPIEETITGKIDEELVQAANGGEITPKAQAAADALAQSLISAGAEPAMRERWWRRFDDPAMQNTGPSGLLMLRVNNLISSGVTANTNFFNGMLNLARFPLQQAGGAVAQGEMKRAMYSMLMYQQYWMNLSNAMRIAGHSLKAGRSLMNMDVSSLDWLDRIAQRDAQGELLSGPDAQTGWTINTVNMSQEYAQRPIGQFINRVWQVVGTGASRLALGIDTFNSTLAGYSYEHVRHLPRGMDLAMERGMKEFSPEAWKFAQQYADARTQETMKSAVIDGKNLADVVMESPQAQNFMNAINFTDNVWAELETRTLSNGISIGQSKGLSGNDLQDFAQKYVDEGQMQHRLANFALNHRNLAFGRIGSLPGEAMQTLSNARGIGPIFKFLQPFQRVPSNIIKSAMRNTPAAIFVDTWWRDVTSEDAFTRDRAIGEVALGSAALSMVAMASGLGYLRFNGGGPIDPAAKEKWTTIEKRMPYSIQIWDETARTWSVPTSMRALEPFATLFGAIGDYTDIANSLSTESRNRLGSSLVLTLAQMSAMGMLGKSYFQGFNELYQAAFDPGQIITGPSQRNRLSRLMSRIVASLVPYSSSLRASRRETDPISRTVDPSDIGGLMGFFQETLDEVRNATPGWSNTLPARRDWINGAPILTQGILGAEIIPADMPWLQAAMQFTPFAAFQQGRETLGPVHEEMGMLSGKGTNFSGPRAADFGPEMRLTPSELEDYVVRFASVKDEYGLTFEQTATKLIESPQYQSWPIEGPSSRDVSLRAAAIQTEIQRFKKLAKEDFKFNTVKGQLIAAEEAEAEARKAEKTYIQRYGMDNSLQPAQPSAPWSPTPR